MQWKSVLFATTILVNAAGFAGPGVAQEATADSIAALKKTVEEQARLLQKQAADIEQQRRELDEQRRQLQEIVRQQAEGAAPARATAAAAPKTAPAAAASSAAAAQAAQAPAKPTQSAGAGQQLTAPPPDAATRPKERENKPEQEITIISDQGGVLTPKGTITFEPTLSASHSSSNRFFFQGVEIVDAVLIGTIEATEARTNIITPQLGVRYGVTNRMEVSAKVPFVWNDNRVESTVISEEPDTAGQPTFLQNLSGKNLGDIELGMQYQLNSGRGGWPFFVGNLRVKSTTGRGPYDVKRDQRGLETQLPTGSGFWSAEPSVTMILQSDPAVFFTNLSYIWNMKKNVDFTAGNNTIGKVDPGDVISGSVGIGFALNDTLSMSMGYQHNYIFGTKSTVNGKVVKDQDFQVGSFLFGVSMGIGHFTSVSMNIGIGVTEESPDVEFTLRVPLSFSLNN